ncbi:DUF3575 domain-containing protein [Aquimarina sp. 2304DJ70-9]|uniref:DUF3575 domain-containing protein n=1 Tax=Aquimarina penaris TaxID=3231044 RepID=UPI0034630BED
MKKIGCSMLIVLLTIVSINAQEVVNEKEKITFMPKHIIKVFPLNALNGEIGIGYERVIKPKMSLNFILIQGFDTQHFINNKYERNYNALFQTELRFYLSKRKKAPEGWFTGGGLLTEYNNIKVIDRSNKDIFRFEAGVSGKMGYQWILKKGLKGITIEAAIGLEYRNITEFNTVLDFTVGYSW